MSYRLKRRLVLSAACASIALSDAGCSGANGTAVAPPPSPQPVARTLAFAGAVGYGAGSVGGRGGRVIAVTTLDDAGPGSFRACIDDSGPRTCIFRVAGLIRFTGWPPVIRNPYLTVAGQTAPGDGITIAHAGGSTGRTPILIKGTHDIVIRNIRVRNDRIGGSRGSEDSFTIENSDNVILDHVSASWARDELVNGNGDNDRISITNSIFAQGIPRHDKCALLSSDPKGPQRFSFIGNICAHNGDRNPEIDFTPKSCVEIVNNIFYNAQSEFTEIWEKFGGAPVALIGNNFLAGPNTGPKAVGIARNLTGSKGLARVYLWDNVFDGAFTHVSPLVPDATVTTPPCPGTVTAMSADKAYRVVLATAGAFPRDSLDAKTATQIRKRTGRIVREPGMIPDIISGTPYPDADRDGMDDGWEAAHGADPRRFDAWADADRDGVANLDAFMDDLARRVIRQAKS